MMATASQQRQRVMAIVAHPDDEVLGCGGALRTHVLAGDEVCVVILADGETSRSGSNDAGIVAKRENAARSAAKVLGVHQLEFQRLPDNGMDGIPRLELAKLVEKYVQGIAPDTIYTHHAGDLNVDHRRVNEAVLVASRPQAGNSLQTLLFFETPSSTEWQRPDPAVSFIPNWFVDISDVLDVKLRALKAYQGEMRDWPHPRSFEGVQHLAGWRGAIVGCRAAEAFMLGRRVVR
jgi:LmbE family N-acetylglucosaminyl deacetylase